GPRFSPAPTIPSSAPHSCRLLHDRDRNLVQPALLAGALLFPPPAAGALVLAGLHRARARIATDRRIAAIVQRVVGNIVLVQVVPHVFRAPVGERAELPQAVDGIERRFFQAGARVRLLAPEAGDPGALAREGALERFDLAHVAAGLALLHAVVET